MSDLHHVDVCCAFLVQMSLFYSVFVHHLIKHVASSITESTIIIREPGESITLKCSSEGCPQNNDGYAGMYLYHNFIEQKEVYFYGNYANSKIMERPRYEGRIESNGAPMNHNITISNLTVDDSGVYTCVYKESADKGVNCNVYTVFVRGEFLFFLVKNSATLFCSSQACRISQGQWSACAIDVKVSLGFSNNPYNPQNKKSNH
uniref:Ig-like domain-containing protein n=1 Tax=Maylandia zebra TaxID=106582 RepID=A0A3P9DBJ5_9CICH